MTQSPRPPQPRPLQVVRQPCHTCRLQAHCWRPELSVDATTVNLLVCRYKQNDNKAAKALLQLLQPKLRSIATAVAGPLGVSTTAALREAESEAMLALSEYVLGMRAHPLYYLFAPRTGRLSKWQQKVYKQPVHEPLATDTDAHIDTYAYMTEPTANAEVAVDESVLDFNEFRVWRLLLAAEKLGLGVDAVRQVLQDRYAVEAVGRAAAIKLQLSTPEATTHFCQAIGIEPPGVLAQQRRTQKRRAALTPSERERIAAAPVRVSTALLAAVYGVGRTTVAQARAQRADA